MISGKLRLNPKQALRKNSTGNKLQNNYWLSASGWLAWLNMPTAPVFFLCKTSVYFLADHSTNICYQVYKYPDATISWTSPYIHNNHSQYSKISDHTEPSQTQDKWWIFHQLDVYLFLGWWCFVYGTEMIMNMDCSNNTVKDLTQQIDLVQ